MQTARQRSVMSYVTVTLMTFDKQSNGRRVVTTALLAW